MYDHLLEAFISVADSGSFSEASNKLFISTTAIIKKINSLESNYGLKLFDRTNRGVTLTEAGKSLYRDAKYLINYSTIALARAKKASENEADRVIRIGKSFNTPCDVLLEIWPRILEIDSSLNIDIVPFDNSTERVNRMFENLGLDIDAYIGLLDPAMLMQRKCIGLRLSQEPFRIAVPLRHHLSKKKHLKLKDLYGERLVVVQRGRFITYDDVREEITKNHPHITIVDCETIRMDAFNYCENTCSAIVTLDAWKNIHPLFKTLSVDWDFSAPFGIVCSANPSAKIHVFLDATKCALGLTDQDEFYNTLQTSLE